AVLRVVALEYAVEPTGAHAHRVDGDVHGPDAADLRVLIDEPHAALNVHLNAARERRTPLPWRLGRIARLCGLPLRTGHALLRWPRRTTPEARSRDPRHTGDELRVRRGCRVDRCTTCEVILVHPAFVQHDSAANIRTLERSGRAQVGGRDDLHAVRVGDAPAVDGDTRVHRARSAGNARIAFHDELPAADCAAYTVQRDDAVPHEYPTMQC